MIDPDDDALAAVRALHRSIERRRRQAMTGEQMMRTVTRARLSTLRTCLRHLTARAQLRDFCVRVSKRG